MVTPDFLFNKIKTPSDYSDGVNQINYGLTGIYQSSLPTSQLIDTPRTSAMATSS